MTETATPLTRETMVRGEHYNWKNQPERLVYLGHRSGNGHWHQFRKVDDPRPVWCEVTDGELHYFEVTRHD